jgi:hypothetical protein
MAIPRPRLISSEMTGRYRFKSSMFLNIPILYVEIKRVYRRFSLNNDEVTNLKWDRATIEQAIELQVRSSEDRE